MKILLDYVLMDKDGGRWGLSYGADAILRGKNAEGKNIRASIEGKNDQEVLNKLHEMGIEVTGTYGRSSGAGDEAEMVSSYRFHWKNGLEVDIEPDD